MTVRAFVDTNVLVYAFDDGEPAKRDRARALLTAPPAALVISAQVIGEFYVVVTRKLARPLDKEQASAAVTELLRFPVVPIDGDLVRAAVSTARAQQLSYWDALIVEAAAASGCDRVLSEDLSHGTSLRTVRVENPFL